MMSCLNKCHGNSIVKEVKLILSIVSIIVGSGFLPATAQDGSAASPNALAASVNAFPAEAEKLGVRQCANLFSALGQGVAQGSAYTVQTQTDDSAPDAHTVQGLVGMRYDDASYTGQAAGVVIATPVGKDCEGQMVRVAPFQQSCADVVGLLPAGSAAASELSGVPLYNLGGNQGQALLVASGASCVVVTVTRATDVR